MIIRIRAIPNSRKNEIVEWKDNVLKVRIAAAPEKGNANEALVKFLKKEFRVPVKLLSGETSRLKRVEVEMDEKELMIIIKEGYE